MNGVMRNCCPVYHLCNIIKPDNIVITYHYFRIVSQTLQQRTTVISDVHNNTWTMITEWNYYRCNKAYLYCCIGFISKALIAINANMCIRLKLGQAPLSSLHVYMTLGCLNSQLDTQKQLCKIKKSLQSSLVRLATVLKADQPQTMTQQLLVFHIGCTFLDLSMRRNQIEYQCSCQETVQGGCIKRLISILPDIWIITFQCATNWQSKDLSFFF